MEAITFALFITYISAVNCYQVKQIEGVSGDCTVVLFDSKSNSYLRCSDLNTDDTERLHKLDSENNVVFVKEFVDFACGISLNDKDELFLRCPQFSDDTNDIVSTDIRIIRANSSEIENIASLDGFQMIFEDNTGNIMYSVPGQGLFLLKYNTTEPVAVKNLENFEASTNIFLTDYNEDTYVRGNTMDEGVNTFAVIPAAAKEGTPEGYFIQGLLDDPANDFVDNLKLTPNNELLISINNNNGKASLKKLWNGTITTIYSNEVYGEYRAYPGKNRTLIIATDSINGSSRITSLSIGGEIVEIQNQRNQPWTGESKIVSIDEEGNAFIAYFSVQELRSHLEFLKNTDTVTVDVDLESQYIYDMGFDGNNNLWMNSNLRVSVIEKSSLEVQAVPDSMNMMYMYVNPKRKASEVHLGTNFRYFVIQN